MIYPAFPDIEILEQSEFVEEGLNLKHIAEHMGANVEGMSEGSVNFGTRKTAFGDVGPKISLIGGEEPGTTVIFDWHATTSFSAMQMHGISGVDRVRFIKFKASMPRGERTVVVSGAQVVLESKTGSITICREGKKYALFATVNVTRKKKKAGR